MSARLCLYFNGLASYRKTIFTMIDKEDQCKWYLPQSDLGLKQFEDRELKDVTRLKTLRFGPFFYVKGLLPLLRKDFDAYFMLGETGNISLFLFCLVKKLFYPQKRVCFWTHGFYGKESWVELTFWKRPFFKLADALFPYGDYSRKLMIEDGFDGNRIFPIHNSLDYNTQMELRKQVKKTDVFIRHFNSNSPVVIFLGRLTAIKCLDMLVQAISILKRRGFACNLVFVGDGPERKNLEVLAQREEISNQIWLYGECYDEQINAELLYNSNLCVAPGNIGLTAIHSLMFGCPAISHNDFYHQMPEFEAIKENATGDFFEYGNVDSLADTIEKWLKNHKGNQEEVREACYKEVDTNWNPYYQMDIVKYCCPIKIGID